jgi:hypothetical protein
MGGSRSEGIVPVRSVVLSRFFIRCLEVAGAGVASAICAYGLGQIGSKTVTPPPQTVAQVGQVAQVALAVGDSVRVVVDAPVPLVEAAPKEPETQKEAETQEQPQAQKDEPPKQPESAAAAPTPAPMPTAAPTPAAVPVPTAAPAPKPAKPAHTAQPRRQHKPEQPAVAETKPQSIQPPLAAADGAPKSAAQGVPAVQSADVGPARAGSGAPAANSSGDDRPLFAKLKLVPSWFSSGNDKPAEKPIAAEKPVAAERPVADIPRPPMPVGEVPRSAM